MMYKVSVCLLIKDENRYVDEWIRHHVGIGIEHFYIYDNGSIVPIAQTVLEKFPPQWFTFVDWSGRYESMQVEAYNHCLQHYGAESQWIAFIDTDEFLQWQGPDALDGYSGWDYVRVPWVLYNANGHLRYSPEPVQERFTQRVKPKGPGICHKSIVQPGRISVMDVHNPRAGVGGDANDICLNHYFTRSLEEWQEKIARGSCGPFCLRKYDEFFLYNPDLVGHGADFSVRRQNYGRRANLFDIRIMAHPSRRENVLRMLSKLDMDEDIVSWDDRPNGGDAIYTAEKAWLSPAEPGITHRVVLQDDIELCDKFLCAVGKIIRDLPDACVSLYNGLPADLRADKTNPYIQVNEVCGPGIILPMKYVQDCWAWIARQPDGPDRWHDDRMILRYCQHRGVPIYSTVPLTIQHIGDTEYKSLLPAKYLQTRTSPLYSATGWAGLLSKHGIRGIRE